MAMNRPTIPIPDSLLTGARWGQSHTRWTSSAGDLCRAFVQVFTTRSLRKEVRMAGFDLGPWCGNHCLLSAGPATAPDRA
jgi:hypothetical protein